jgi:hypothetical protein
MLSYDLHVHAAPSTAPRWGDGARVHAAAVEAGVRGFVWKSHEEHTVARCLELPAAPVRAIGSASLNPWARVEDLAEAVEAGALWVWGPTQVDAGKIGWDLTLPESWGRVSRFLAAHDRPLVLATGHLGAPGRAAFAALAAASEFLVCSITHSLYVPLDEVITLAERGCVFEVDAYTYALDLPGRRRGDIRELLDVGALAYFTSDGGQATTGNPFHFGARVLDQLADVIGRDAAITLGVENPAAVVQRLDSLMPA